MKSNHTLRLKTYTKGVPPWPAPYVDSYEELFRATKQHRAFYRAFKVAFNRGQFYDLEGSNNYALVLLQDFRRQYTYHKMAEFEMKVKLLCRYYPEIKIYAMSLLMHRLRNNYDMKGLPRVRNQQSTEYQVYATDGSRRADFWWLGDRFATKLKLNKKEVAILNKVLFLANYFNSIDYCCEQAVKLFLLLAKSLEKEYKARQSSLQAEFADLAAAICRMEGDDEDEDESKTDSVAYIEMDLYTMLFEECENSVRDQYDYEDLLEIEPTFSTLSAERAHHRRVGAKVAKLLPGLASRIAPPDMHTEIELSKQDPTKWRVRFEELTDAYNESPRECMAGIFQLGEINRHSSGANRLYFEAYRFAVNKDRKAALSFYLHYYWHDSNSGWPMKKTMDAIAAGKLFKGMDEEREFAVILKRLIVHKDIEKALQALTIMLQPKRRHIKLDSKVIETTRKTHVSTVDVLNRYLQEEDQAAQPASSAKPAKPTKAPARVPKLSVYSPTAGFSPVQESLLALFSKQSLSLSKEKLESFCRQHSVFAGQLVDSINEAAYDLLDDVLIEEEGDDFVIAKDSYRKLLKE